MKNKFLLIPIMVIFMLFGFIQNAQALVQNEADLNLEIQKLTILRDNDTLQMINKAELIGYRLDNFNSARYAYNSSISSAIDQLNMIKDNVSKLKSDPNVENNIKEIEEQRYYQEANNIIINLNNQASMYIYNLRMYMPSITYDRYTRKFWDFYNSLGI